MWRSKLFGAVAAAGLALGFLLPAGRASAVSTEASELVRFDQPFGGYIVVVNYVCENGPIYLLIFDFRTFITLPLLFQPWSRLNEDFALSYGNSVVGTYLPIPGQCVLSYYPYVALYAIGEISPYPYPGIGTSLLPFGGAVEEVPLL